MRQTSMMKAHAMVYGVVVYDFQSERPDELDAKAGEPIIVVAQSNPEWFVAKPIGRLGGPGLIPVSYVELKDTVTGKAVTDPLAAVRAAGVPRVEEWKKTAAEYKNNSITLGEITQARTGQTLQHQPQRHQQQPDVNGLSQNMENMNIQQRKVSLHSQAWQSTDESQQQPPLPQPTGPLAPRSACVPRYCFDNDQYWYIIECEMEDGRCWELSRYYADFYDFQIKLLSMFPREAGTEGNGERLLPYMPGPVAHVTDAISNGRRENLDIYIKQVIKLPAYISKCILVRELFEPRDQDYEIDPAALNENFRLSAQSMAPSLSASQARSSTSSHPRSSAGVYTSNVPLPQTHKRGPSMGATPNGSNPALHTQASNLTTNSAVSQKPQANSGAALRIKVEFQEEIVAIRVPSNIDFDQLQSKVMERLRISSGADVVIKYRDDQAGTVASLNNNTDLDTAIQRNANLRLVVSYA
ncbi:hypothetical protein BT93_L4302 [Corymbia citriodora subsp. variegata]|uniref:Uncharacterized protein n=1 Tax=Corymbia citriodora subsp. variegata TaxID=360336 RepID=A0A8T0CG89_CORYI|nr:hypothetical protein BT93_L4302 [Corymbia citriodora subsp. variegata]